MPAGVGWLQSWFAADSPHFLPMPFGRYCFAVASVTFPAHTTPFHHHHAVNSWMSRAHNGWMSRAASTNRRLIFRSCHGRYRQDRSSTAVSMIFQRFFGGGAYDLKIDYTALDFPGPELAAAATDGVALAHSPSIPRLSVATFAGGCFWGLELAYQRVPGVEYTVVGYTQGIEKNPTYQTLSNTGHTEAVTVYFDESRCKYTNLLETFFERVDPTMVNGQGRDYGRQYRTGVYYHTAEQENEARQRFEREQDKHSRGPIATELKKATAFWPAEKYHQQYLEKGGRFGMPQNASKGATDEIRCYG